MLIISLGFCLITFIWFVLDDVFSNMLISMLIILICFVGLSINSLVECVEKNKPIHPEIIHTSDSSTKIFRYSFEGNQHTIAIDRKNAMFHVPESLITICPCTENIQIKE